MFSHKFFLLLFFLFLLSISGFCIYRLYFLKKPEIVPLFSESDTSPAPVNITAPEKVSISPPNYEGNINKPENSNSDSMPSSTDPVSKKEEGEKPKVPSVPSEFIIVHSGSIVEIGSDFLIFEEQHPEGNKKFKAQITTDTEIRLITVPRTIEPDNEKDLFQVNMIKLDELKINDQILVLGMVKNTDQATFQAIRIDKSDYR